jgi:protein NRD1
MSRSSIAANTFPKEPDAFDTSHESSNKTGQPFEMENFDISTFDPTSPASWEAMGKMWEITNGYQPSTEELMQFVMMGTMSQLHSKNWQQGDGLSGCGNDQRQGGRGGQHGNSRSDHHGWANDGMNGGSTDAVVLGGGEMEMDESSEGESPQRQELVNSGTRPGGKMQKVGDRWVFVRNDTGVR